MHEREERQIPMILPFASGLQGLGGGFAGSGFNYEMGSCDKLKMYLAMVGQAHAIETTQIADQCIPKVKYTVKSGPNGVSQIVNDDGDYKNKGSDKGVLCEFSSIEKCPEGYELFRHSCYKYFDQKADFPEAKSACEQQEGWLPKIRDDEVNRYIACKL
uniref:C-type lectin domain-containing protein n=1 Tax=Panagrolaimus sp. ES5 TaxID=591445 RepID=A0AC34F8K5_9BILA